MKERESFTRKWKRILALTLVCVITLSLMPNWIAKATSMPIPDDISAIIAGATNWNAGEITVREVPEDRDGTREEEWTKLDVQEGTSDGVEKHFWEVENGKTYKISVALKQESVGKYEIKFPGGTLFTDKDGDGVYTYEYVAEDDKRFEFEVNFEKIPVTNGIISAKVTTESSVSGAVGASVAVYVLHDGENKEMEPTISNGKQTYVTEVGKTYTIEVTLNTGYEFDSDTKKALEEFDEKNNVYTKTLEATEENPDYSIEIATKAKKYTITLELNEGGTVWVDDTAYKKTSLWGGKTEISVEYGSRIEIQVLADLGYYISGMKKNGTEVTDYSLDETGRSFTLEKIASDITLKVEFTKINEKTIDDLSEIGVLMEFDPESDEATKEETGSEYIYTITNSGSVTLSQEDGYRICINGETTQSWGNIVYNYAASKKIEKEITIREIYVWNTKEGREVKYTLKKPITFIVDDVSPTVTIEETNDQKDSDGAIWVSPGKKKEINGSVTDTGVAGSNYKAGIQKIVWSTKAMTEKEVLAEKTNVINVENNGKFTIEVPGIESGKVTYYIYGVDKASNISEAQTVSYRVDGEAPTIETIGIDGLVEKNGTYYTGEDRITVTVVASDEGSGVNKIVLYRDGEKVDELDAIAVSDSSTKKTATFEIELDKDGTNVITASAVDMMENKPSEEEYGKFKDGASIIYDDVIPTISMDMDDLYAYTNADCDTTYYINKDEEIDLTIEQEVSGLYMVCVTINGRVLTEDANGKSFVEANEKYRDPSGEPVKSDSFVISTAQGVADANGNYTIKVIAVPVVGYAYPSYDKYTKKYVIHKEEQTPVLVGYTITGASQENVSSADEYGFYANTEVTAELTLSDGSDGAGVKSVTYYFKNADGETSEKNVFELNCVPGEDAFVQIPIDTDYKGFLYVKAEDNAGNATTSRYDIAGIIAESATEHEKSSELKLGLEKTGMKDKNGNNLYANDTNVSVNVSDSYSGIKRIEWSVTSPYDTANNKAGSVEVNNDGIVTDGAWSINTTDKNLVTNMTYTIPVSNNSNDISVWVKMTDHAGNTTEKTVVFSIDKTIPTVSIDYNNVTPDNTYGTIYNQVRIATITVTERDFDGSAVAWDLSSTTGETPQISGWTEHLDPSNPDNNTYVTTVTFAADDDYTFGMNYTDKAGHDAVTFGKQSFTIDRTKPEVEVTVDGQASNGNYYATSRTATIRVTEHNFDPNRIVVTGIASDNGQTITFPSVSTWSTDGDVHTTTITFGTDGVYSFNVNGTDKAGNIATENAIQEFIVDLTNPTIEITGVADHSANNDVVAPIVTFYDTNFNEAGAKIQLVGANHGVVEAKGTYSNTENGQVFTFSDFAREQDVDDIYTLTATEVDYAGNEVSQSITFSVNRFGSVYVFDSSLKEIEGTYIQKPIDVVLTEKNVDSLAMDSIKIIVSANGTPQNLVEGTDYTVASSGGNGSWSQYTYTIKKDVFSGDGTYTVSVYSEDSAGNVNENINESKKAEIDFGVDGTAPVIVPINIEDDSSYNAQNYNAAVSVIDNLVLSDVEIRLDDKAVTYTQDGDDFNFDIPESSARQNLVVVARDAAGNEVECAVDNFLVSTNSFVRYINNKALVVGSIVGVAVVGVGAGTIFGFRRKNVVRIKSKK